MTHAGVYASSTFGKDGDGNQYIGGNSDGANADLVPFDENGAPIAERYNKIIEGGRENIRLVSRVDFPSSIEDLRDMTWGGTVPDSEMWRHINDKGPLLVNTEAGPNVPGGKVSGGIFISGWWDAEEVQLDLTAEGHQKTCVRQGSSTVPGPDTVAWKKKIPIYKKRETYMVDITRRDCKDVQRTRDVYETRNWTETVTRSGYDEGRCGFDWQAINGSLGVVERIKVARFCSWEETVNRSERVKVGTETYTAQECTTVKIGEEERTRVVGASAGDEGAYQDGEQTVDSHEGAEGAYAVETTGNVKSIPQWNAVVEVNEAPYKIPFQPGIKINGVEITDANDPALTVPDGNTVSIRNDYSDSAQSYAEYTVMEGRINGVTFSDQTIQGLRGTNKGSYYADSEGQSPSWRGRVIAANIENNKEVHIRDSILQFNDSSDVDEEGAPLSDGSNRLTIGKESPNEKHILGIIGKQIHINPTGQASNYDKTRTNEREANLGGRDGGGETKFRGGSFRGGINVYAILMVGGKEVITSEGGFGAHDSAMHWDDMLVRSLQNFWSGSLPPASTV